MNTVTVTVIIPVYNAEKFLVECIDSVIGQTYKKLQIILVDDGSNDSCGQICDQYEKKDSRIKVIHQENSGVSSARNTGLYHASGDYVTFVDCDDIINERMIEILVEEATKYDLDIVATPISRSRSVLEKLEIDDVRLYNFEIITDEEFSILLRHELLSGILGKLYKCEFLEDKSFRLGQQWGEDLCFNLKLLEMKPIIGCSVDSLYYYRATQGSLSVGFKRNKYDDFIYTYRSLFSYICKKNFQNGSTMHVFEKRIAADWVWWIEQIKNAPGGHRTRDLLALLKIRNDDCVLEEHIMKGISSLKLKPYINLLFYHNNPFLWYCYLLVARKRKK